MTDVQGRVGFITGGASGIGLGIARAFAKAGAKLALADIDKARLEEARTELAEFTRVETYVLDVRDRDAFTKVADQVEHDLGPVSLVFNNAGVGGGAPPAKLTYAMWDWVMGVNLNGVIHGVQTFLPRIAARGQGGHIVNTASGAGLVAVGTGVLYHTSKFAVVGMSEALHAELQADGIGVSVLCPGPVATRIMDTSATLRPEAPPALTPEQQALAEQSAAWFRKALAEGVHPDEVGRMVLDAVQNNRLHILTDRVIEQALEARTKALFAALPAAQA
ncbi:SDR family NAD(P)-dependent oxidoreductase [Zavarzinia sp. CC-PAN008]|uniref:SDR family NAD(P)-dependent oxidoreductase n=1 Tax=Zavarzinia sp. CC-PAN008 TaxID=3243332 RepID=UPI003F749A31